MTTALGEDILEWVDLSTTVVRILLVDDYEPYRIYVRSLIEQRPELQIVGEVSDGLQAVQKVGELRPDLVLLDIGLPHLSGIEVARRIRSATPQSSILFLTHEFSPEIVSEALILGASGYIIKSDARRDLLAGIDAAVRGERFLSSGVTTPGLRRLEPDRQQAIDIVRAAIARGQSEADRLYSLIENGASPEISLWAKGDLERLIKRIQAQVDELAKLLSE
jgi:DNA-binding NarL/FixJ family response regulator